MPIIIGLGIRVLYNHSIMYCNLVPEFLDRRFSVR